MKTTLIKHEKSISITPYQVTGLALELAKLPDGSIDRDAFSNCCDQAFDILLKLHARIASLAAESPSEHQNPL